MKDENKTKAELIKELKTLRKKQGKSALNDFVEYKQNEEKYQSFTKDILDFSAVGMFILDSDFKVVWINHSTEKYFGLQREKVIGKDKRKLIKKNIQHIFEDPDEFIRKVFATYDNNTYVENFECHVLPEGKRKERWLEHWSQPIKSGLYTGGRIEHYYDITERKQAEQALKDSEEKYRTVFENTGTATIIIEEDKTISMVNTQSEKMYGYSKEEIENKMKWTDFVIPEDLERMKKYHIARRKAGEKPPTEYEFRLIDKKGNTRDIFLKIGMIPNTKKSIASLMDITERKQAEEELKDSEKRLKILFDYAPDAYYINDLKGKFIDGNKVAERLMGYKKEELIGKSFLKLNLLSLADIPRAAKALTKSIMGKLTGPDEFVLNRKDNSKVTVEISTYPVKIKGETLVLGQRCM